MTLFRQLALLMSFFLLIILATVLTLNFQSANSSIQEQLYEDAKNTASSLSLSLGTAAGDETIMSTMINANFDSGHYKSIALYSQDEKLIYERKIESTLEDVPSFFVKNVDIKIPTASAQVSSGWSPIGLLQVQSDNSYAYRQLYGILMNLLISFFILAVVGLMLLNILIHIILKPLKEIQHQAEAILDNHFIIQEKIPYTLEFKDVVNGMNVMVNKVEDIFNNASEAAKRNRELLYNDPVTKLFNRRYMMLKLPDLLTLENQVNGGSLMFVALDGAQIINSVLGRQDADKLFLEFSNELKEISNIYEESLVSRVNGTEFSLLLPTCKSNKSQELAEAIERVFNILLEKNALLDEEEIGLSIGIYRYHQGANVGDVLTKADSALTLAKADNNANIHYLQSEEGANALGKEEWRKIITTALENDHFNLIFRSVVNASHEKAQEIHEVMTFSIVDKKFGEFQYGKYIPFAITFTLVDEIYEHILEKLFLSQRNELKNSVISIRLSGEFLKETKSIATLSSIFEKYTTKNRSKYKLVFEVSDSFSIHNTELLAGYVELFKKYSFGFVINQFTGESDDYRYLKELRPMYIKADSKFLLDQSSDSMATIKVVADSIGAEIVATFVHDEEQLEALKAMKIVSFQGPYAEKIV